MSAPPVPPRPYDLTANANAPTQRTDPNATQRTDPTLPPPVPPLPPDIRLQNERYNTPSPYEYEYEYESPPRFENPMIAPRPHRLDASIPANMAKTLDEQLYRQPPPPPPPPQHASSLPPPQAQTSINYTPGFVIPQANSNSAFTFQTHQAPQVDLATSIANLSMASYAPPPPPLPASSQSQSQSQPPPPPLPQPPASAPLQTPGRPTTPSSQSGTLPSLTAPLPQLSQLLEAAAQIQAPAHDPALKIAWCRDVFFLVDRAQSQGNPAAAPSADPPVGPVHVANPDLARMAEIAVGVALQVSKSWAPGQQQGQGTQGQQQQQGKMPPYVAEAIYMRAMLAATGAFPEHVRHNPRTAFRDFEAAARGGFGAAWFRLGRDYENFNDHAHARECFERGVRLGVESCLYRMGMAHLLGQLSLPQNPPLALPLLHRAAQLASLHTPQPAYVYALLLLAEFQQITLPPSLFAPFIPAHSSPTLEARTHLERAAYLHFAPAQYKLGHAYEFAEPPFPFDPLLSVQYYSLASQQGEVEADMALSKWFLCGSGGAALALQGAGGGQGGGATTGGFEKDEGLALTFAEKAARKGLPSAEFAMGYYAEVGVGQPKDVKKAIVWYERAKSHGNPDALTRLAALSQPDARTLSRHEHDSLTQAKLVRRRTQAAQRAETQPLSPPWEGRTFPSASEWESQQGRPQQQQQQGQGQGQGLQGAAPAQAQAQRRRQDGRMVVDVIRKNSMAAGYTPPSTTNGSSPSSAPAGPPSSFNSSNNSNSNIAPLNPRQRREQSPGRQPSQPVPVPNQVQGQRYEWMDNPPRTSSPRTQSPGSSNRRTESPNRSGRVTPQGPQGGREPSPSPGRGGRLPIGSGAGSSTSLNQQQGQGTPPTVSQSTGGRSKLERMRLNLNLDEGGASFAPSPPSGAGGGGGAGGATPGRGAVPTSTSTPSTARPLPPIGGGGETPNTGALDTPRPGGGGAGGATSSTSSLGGGTNPNSNHKRPQTFAEMGIHGAKVDDKECVVM